MRSAPTAQITSLLGSVALHVCAVVVLVLAARRAQPVTAVAAPERADAWLGASAVEVDAVATPEATPNIENAASSQESEADSAASRASEPAAAQPTSDAKPILEANESARVDPAPAPVRAAIQPPKPKPTPRRSRPSKPANPSSGTAAVAARTASDGKHDESTPATTGTFGSEGLPPGVRSLPSAFARAIPPATGADPVWQSLPTGTQKPFVLAVEVDAEGHIASAKILGAHDGEETPPQFEHLRQRVIALLGGGLFALQNNGAAGRDLFRITITLSDRAVKDEAEPAQLVERGFEPPRGRAPGRAYFTLASGRHFEAKVEVLGAPPRPKHP